MRYTKPQRLNVSPITQGLLATSTLVFSLAGCESGPVQQASNPIKIDQGETAKATICHFGRQTITVALPALRAHLGHGDTLGPCKLDAGMEDDGGITPDSGLPDAGVRDAGPGDAGPVDAGPVDAGPVDAGPVDAGPGDAGPVDAGPRDAGPADAGPVDAGPVDAGPRDAGPADAGAGDGAIDVSVGFNLCPKIVSYQAAPLSVRVGGFVFLEATAVDADGDPLTVLWTSSDGVLSPASALNTRYQCTSAGEKELRLSVADATCEDVVQFPVTCTP